MSARPSASITVSAVLAITGSVLALIGILFGALGIAMMKSAPNVPALPPGVQVVASVFILVFAGVAVFGIFTGIGLLRLKNWARISVLVFSGLVTVFSALIIVFMMFLPIPVTPGQPPAMAAFMKVFILIFYGIPLGIGVWWLILFTRKKIADQFTLQTSASSEYSTAQFEMTASAPSELPRPVAPSKPQCPLPVMVVGGFWIFSSLTFLFVLYSRTPMVIFGHPFNRSISVILWVLTSILYVVAALGLFRLKPWGLSLSLALQSFWIVSGIVSMSNPGYEDVIRQNLINSPLIAPENITPQYIHSIRLYGLAGTLAGFIVIAILLIYRSRFLAACQAASPLSENSPAS